MNCNNKPWWAGVLFALLALAAKKYPEVSDLVDALILGLAGGWGAHIVATVKNGNGTK